MDEKNLVQEVTRVADSAALFPIFGVDSSRLEETLELHRQLAGL